MTDYLNIYKQCFLALLALMPFLIQAQGNDAEAEAIMFAVNAKYKAYKNYRIDYTQYHKNLESNQAQQMKGTLHVMDNMFRLHTPDVIFTQKNDKIWIYFEAANEVVIDYYDPEEFISPSPFPFNFHEEGFKCTKTGETQIGTKVYDELLFLPVDQDDSDVRSIRLYINQENFEVAKAEMVDQMNEQVIFQYDKLSTNLDISESFFEFNYEKYDGVWSDVELVVTDNTQ